MKLWWLSFADPNKPTGTQFLGASIVKAHRFDEAVKVAHILGCNPGGEVKGFELPSDYRVPDEFVGKLMDKEQCKAFDKTVGGPGEIERI
jgi:hypothetical protein